MSPFVDGWVFFVAFEKYVVDIVQVDLMANQVGQEHKGVL